eukprot:1156295-Pelagomonas_calceolata.AAC.2
MYTRCTLFACFTALVARRVSQAFLVLLPQVAGVTCQQALLVLLHLLPDVASKRCHLQPVFATWVGIGPLEFPAGIETTARVTEWPWGHALRSVGLIAWGHSTLWSLKDPVVMRSDGLDKIAWSVWFTEGP